MIKLSSAFRKASLSSGEERRSSAFLHLVCFPAKWLECRGGGGWEKHTAIKFNYAGDKLFPDLGCSWFHVALRTKIEPTEKSEPALCHCLSLVENV